MAAFGGQGQESFVSGSTYTLCVFATEYMYDSIPSNIDLCRSERFGAFSWLTGDDQRHHQRLDRRHFSGPCSRAMPNLVLCN